MLPETGSISMSQVNVELKKSETAVITLNDTDVRKLAGKPSGVISMNDLRGKKASEYVENYHLYSNTWTGVSESGSFVVNFPHKVISGEIEVFANSNSNASIGRIKLLNEMIYGYSETKKIKVNNMLSINGEYYTGYSQSGGSSGTKFGGKVSVDIKFTGEWEA